MKSWHTLWRNLQIRLQIVRMSTPQAKEVKFFHELSSHFSSQQKDIHRGKRKHPVDMTLQERHEATREVTRKMKWSKNFVETMKTPIALRALENGGSVYDAFSGIDVGLTTREMERLKKKGITRENFKQFQREWTDSDLMQHQRLANEEPE